MSIESITTDVLMELASAEAKFKPFNSSHEGYAVILEELDELWDVVKLNPKKVFVPPEILMELASRHDHERRIRDYQEAERKKMMRAEAIQVAAMATRFIKCICDKDEE